MQKLSDFVIELLLKNGIDHIFMLPGGGAMHLNDSVGKHPVLKYTINLHEQACAIAAEAYAQYRNDIGALMVTTGPGATNSITGVTSAWLDSIPLLIISGQVKRVDMIGDKKVRQMGFQEINIIDIVKPITKFAVTVTQPELIKYYLQKAIYLAKSGRPGPVWIDIPLDVQAAMIDENNLKSFDNSESQIFFDNNLLKDQVLNTIKLFNESIRPVILVGNGLRLSNGYNEFITLINLLKIPVLTTWKALDLIDENNEFYIGRPGSVGQRAANFAQQNSDFIMILGSRLDLGQTGYNHKNFAKYAKKIMVDIDMNEINKLMTNIDVKICSDLKVFLTEFINQSTAVISKNRTNWLNKCLQWKQKYPVVLKEYYEQKDFVNDYVLIDLLSEQLNENDLIIPGSSGACSERTMQAFKVKKGMRIFNSEGLGPMGFGLPAAIGGCIASGRKRTISIDGDGGFIMNIQELETVKRLNLPIKFFILNNKGYASIRATQKNYFNSNFVGSNAESGLTLPDFCKVAFSYGINSLKINNNQELKNNLQAVLNSDGPFLCELMVDPDQLTAPRIVSVQGENGSIISKPLEDMWPFLDRDEFNANMLVKD